MKLEQQQKIEVQNLLKIIRRAKFDDFQGVEALALARAYSWLESLLKEPEIQVDVSAPATPMIVSAASDPMAGPFVKELELPKKKGRPKKL